MTNNILSGLFGGCCYGIMVAILPCLLLAGCFYLSFFIFGGHSHIVEGAYGMCINILGLLPYLILGYIQTIYIKQIKTTQNILKVAENCSLSSAKQKHSLHINKFIYSNQLSNSFIISISFFTTYIYHHQTTLFEELIRTKKDTFLTHLFNNNDEYTKF